MLIEYNYSALDLWELDLERIGFRSDSSMVTWVLVEYWGWCCLQKHRQQGPVFELHMFLMGIKMKDVPGVFELV